MTSSGSGAGGKGQLKVSSETVGSLLSEKLDHVAQLRAEFASKKVAAENSPAQQHANQASFFDSSVRVN